MNKSSNKKKSQPAQRPTSQVDLYDIQSPVRIEDDFRHSSLHEALLESERGTWNRKYPLPTLAEIELDRS